MTFITLLLIAFGLSMDAFAVSITKGMTRKKNLFPLALQLAFFFGLFQAVMPLLGFFLGKYISHWLGQMDHWIAFILLTGIGCKMILEAFKNQPEHSFRISLTMLTILGLSIATSIDAFAVGISFAFLKIQIISAVCIIGLMTCAISFIGVYIGKPFGRLLGRNSEWIGGLILIGIGCKILLFS